MTNLADPQDATGCCRAIIKALLTAPEMEKWTCPKCGLDWAPRLVDGVRLWEAKPIIEVLRGRSC